MIDIKKIEELGLLGSIRQRLGEEENQTSLDKRISLMSAKEVLGHATAWSLGSSDWSDEIIYNFGELVIPHISSLKKELKEEMIRSSSEGRISIENAFLSLDKMMDAIRKEY